MKVRIKFSKTGAMKYIGHLDMMRYFQKAIRRAKIDIAYSGGFSPHQIMSFAAPLGVGLTSMGEYLDIELRNAMDVTDIKERLNQVMAEGVSILAVTALADTAGNAMASVAAAAYEISFAEGTVMPEGWAGQFISFLNRPQIPYHKKTSKVSRMLDLKPFIYDRNVTEDKVYLMVNASSADNIKPIFVMKAFFDSIGLTVPEHSLCICRLETYGHGRDSGDETAEKMRFVPLSVLSD